jgi:hypothetical protein
MLHVLHRGASGTSELKFLAHTPSCGVTPIILAVNDSFVFAFDRNPGLWVNTS